MSKNDAKEFLKDSVGLLGEMGTEVVKDGIFTLFYGLLFKAVVGIVVVVGTITATIYGVSYLFS